MEKFKSKIGVCTFLAFLIAGFLDIGLLMFWGLSGIWIPFLAFTAVFVVFVVPPFFFTEYSLTQDYLKITCLWLAFGKKIKYEDIVAVVPCQSAKVSAKLANECIKIVYVKKGKTKEIFVSPALNDRFINQLTDNVLYCSVIKEKQEDESNLFIESDKHFQVKKEQITAKNKVVVKRKQPIKKASTKNATTKNTETKTTKTVKQPVKKASSNKKPQTKTVKKVVKKTK